MADDSVQCRLAWAGAWLFAVGMVTGVWAAIVITGKIAVDLPRLALAAHLNALLGGLWMIAVVLGVTGLEYTRGDPANNAVAALLHSVVVLPSLVGAAAWAWGLGGRR